MTEKTEKIIRSLKQIAIANATEQSVLIDKFKQQYPDNTDWLEMFTASNNDSTEFSKGLKLPAIEGYEMIKLLGSGANGKVFLGYHAAKKRKVAIKIPMMFLSHEQLQRFAHESRLLARLAHKNIAQLYETGFIENEELPYIVMEHINGVSIQQYCLENQLKTTQIIQLFFQVLDAVQYAHNRGIVHRDLKPDNILVTNDGEVKLLDFGIAATTDNSTQHLTQLTKTGEIVGTLAYMSPEQVSGHNIDTRTDVYSLGVVLYQLLSQSLPHQLDANQIFLAISKIIEDLPKKLNAQNDKIDNDLANIVHHAIEKKPDDRYQSPRELKNDLDNFIQGNVITVKNNTLWQNIKYISRKHKALVTGSILAVLGLITGLVFAVSFAFKEQQARKIAETNAKTSLHTANFINEILISADPDNIYGEELTVLQVIDNAEATIQNELEGEQAVEANIRTTLASVYTSLGQFGKAQKQIDTVESLLKNLTEMVDFIDFHFAIRFIQSKMYLSQSKNEENINLLNELAVATKNNELYQGKIKAALANVYIASSEIEKAKPILLEILETNYPEENKELIEVQLFAQNSYAILLTQTGEFDKAKDILEKLLEKRIKSKGEQHIQTLSVLNSLATVETNLGNLDKAQSILERVIEHRVKALGNTHLSSLISKVNLISVLVTNQKLDLADSQSKLLLDEMESELGPLHERTLQLKNIRAYLLEDLNKIDEAEQLYRSTLNAYADIGINKGAELFALQNNLAMLLMNKNELNESNLLFNQLLDNVKGILGEEHIYYAIFLGNYGELLLKRNEHDKARPLLERSYQKLRETFGENHKRTLKAQKRLEQLSNNE